MSDLVKWLPLISVIVAMFAAFVTYRSYLANRRFSEANYKPVLKVKTSQRFNGHWGVLIENELDRYVFVEKVSFSDARVKAEYEGTRNLVRGHDPNNLQENIGMFIKLVPSNTDKITGQIILEVESFLGVKYRLTTSEITFEKKNMTNENRIWREYLKVKKI